MPDPLPRLTRRRRGPYVPAQVIMRLIEERVPPDEICSGLELARVSTHLPRHVRNGYIERLTIEQADRIIVCMLGDVALWHTVPELAEIYARRWD